MKTTYRFNGADFVGLGHRAYQCEVFMTDENGKEIPLLQTWGLNASQAESRAKLIVGLFNYMANPLSVNSLIDQIQSRLPKWTF